MRQKPSGRPSSSQQIIREIKHKTRKQFSAEEKIRIVLGGLRGEDSIAARPGARPTTMGSRTRSGPCLGSGRRQPEPEFEFNQTVTW